MKTLVRSRSANPSAHRQGEPLSASRVSIRVGFRSRGPPWQIPIIVHSSSKASRSGTRGSAQPGRRVRSESATQFDPGVVDAFDRCESEIIRIHATMLPARQGAHTPVPSD